jgi:hypothetical protein
VAVSRASDEVLCATTGGRIRLRSKKILEIKKNRILLFLMENFRRPCQEILY